MSQSLSFSLRFSSFVDPGFSEYSLMSLSISSVFVVMLHSSYLIPLFHIFSPLVSLVKGRSVLSFEGIIYCSIKSLYCSFILFFFQFLPQSPLFALRLLILSFACSYFSKAFRYMIQLIIWDFLIFFHVSTDSLRTSSYTCLCCLTLKYSDHCIFF